MEQRDFWVGVGCGAAAAAAGALLAARLRRGGASRILRLEKSIEIARPLAQVFEAWSDYERIAAMSRMVQAVRVYGDRSRWTVNVGGVRAEWEAEITRVIPYEAIAWKSVSGPKHSGRITFSHLGNNTLVHVHMNYAPPLRLLRTVLAPFSGDLEGYIEQALRDFKAELEREPESALARWQQQDKRARATGTYGPGPELLTETQNTRFGAPSVPVEYTRPPEAKS